MITWFRRTRQRFVFLLVVTPVLAAGIAADRPKYQLKIAVQAPERSVWGKTLKSISREIAEKSNGEVKLKAYWSGAQGNERTLLRKMRVGQLQGASLIGEGAVDVCPASLVLHLPLLFDNEDEADYVLQRIRSRLEDQCRARGYEVVGWAQMGFSYLFSKDPVRDLATLRKAKPWLIESDPLSRAFYDVLGVTPVSTGAANVLPGLQSGLIRTVASPPVGLVAMQWHSRIKYRVDARITYTSGILVLSRKSWGRLPATLQSTVRDTFEKQLAELNRKIRQQNRDALKEIEKRGVETIRPDAEDRATLVKASEEVGQRLVGEYFSQATLDRVHELRTQYRRSRK